MFPPRPGQCAYIIDGTHTEFLVTEYTDHVFVVATQVGKLGTVFHCEPRGEADVDYLLDIDPEARAVSVRMRTLIGKRDDTTLNACARHIGEVLFARGLQKPLLCALGLRSTASVDALRAVASLVVDRVTELLQSPVAAIS